MELVCNLTCDIVLVDKHVAVVVVVVVAVVTIVVAITVFVAAAVVMPVIEDQNYWARKIFTMHYLEAK